jgi:recombination protein RecA
MATKTKTEEPAEIEVLDRDAELEKVLSQINAQRKKDSPTNKRPAIFYASDHPELLDQGIIKSGNLAFDTLLHGGVRRGRMTVIYGPEAVGKSSLCYELIAYAQQTYGAKCAVVHTEAIFPVEYARMLGVDLSDLLVIQDVTSGDAAFDILRRLLVDDKYQPRNLLDLVLVDSVGAVISSAELKKFSAEGFAADTMGCHPKLMTKVTKLLFATGAVGKAAVVMINQLRDNLSYGGGSYMPGGRAFRHFADVIVYAMKPSDEKIVKNKKQVGHTIRLTTRKNKAGLGGHEGEEQSYQVKYNVGSDNELPLFNAAQLADVVSANGSGYFKFNLPKDFLEKFGLWKTEKTKKGDIKKDEPLTIHGEETAVEILRTTPPLFNALMWIVRDGIAVDEAVARAIAERDHDNNTELEAELSDEAKKLAEEMREVAKKFEENPEAAMADVEKDLEVVPED